MMDNIPRRDLRHSISSESSAEYMRRPEESPAFVNALFAMYLIVNSLINCEVAEGGIRLHKRNTRQYMTVIILHVIKFRSMH